MQYCIRLVLYISGAEFLPMKSTQIKIQRPQAPHVATNTTFLVRIGGKLFVKV